MRSKPVTAEDDMYGPTAYMRTCVQAALDFPVDGGLWLDYSSGMVPDALRRGYSRGPSAGARCNPPLNTSPHRQHSRTAVWRSHQSVAMSCHCATAKRTCSRKWCYGTIHCRARGRRPSREGIATSRNRASSHNDFGSDHMRSVHPRRR